MAALKLSAGDVIAALRGLTEAERAELLDLLQAAEEEESAKPEDTRPPLDQLLEQARQQSAAKSGDPDAWLAADAAHAESRAAHYRRLMGECGASMQDIAAYMSASLVAWTQAGNLAIADGFPDPDRKQVVAPEPAEREEAMQTLPRATRQDIEQSRAREVFAAEQPVWLDGV